MTCPRPRIWVVDDEADVVTYMGTALEDEGFDVRGYDSADGVLDDARREAPDVLCLDIMMPGRSGLSLYRDLRQSPELRGVPIVIVSGYSRQEEFLGEEFRRLLGSDSIPEPDAYLEKPLDIGLFLDLMRSMTRGGAAHARGKKQ